MTEAAFRSVGLVVGALVLLTFVVLWIRNIRDSRAELGSEIELAANKKPYLSDAELEGPKLDRSLSFALVVLGLCSLSLPFYWLAEPGRQEGAIENWDATFARRGERLYTEGAQCVNCHAAGGVGGKQHRVLCLSSKRQTMGREQTVRPPPSTHQGSGVSCAC